MRINIVLMIVFTFIAGKTCVAAENSKFKTINEYLSASVAEGFSGAVLIAQKGSVHFKEGYGLIDRNQDKAITADTLFDIGSVTKQFTAAAIMHLVQEGKLNTSMPLSKFFNDLPQDKQNITLHQLLTHSAGITNGVGAGDFTHVPTEEFFSRVFKAPLYFKPGEGYAYSNAGYSILARVIELVTDMPYEAYIQQNLFAPAGMESTGYLAPELAELPAATGYLYGVVDTGSTRDLYFKDNAIAWPLKGNGGILSSLNDMYLWAQALQNESVLKAEFREPLFAPHVAENEEGSSHYGYGWAVMPTPRETTLIGHNGSNGTYYFDFLWFPTEQTVILFASNALVESTMALPFHVEAFLFDGEPLPAFESGLTSDIVRISANTSGEPEQKKAVLLKHFAGAIDDKRTLNRAGIRLMDKGVYDDAIALFLVNVELYGDDGNLWDSLGEAYFANQQYEQAKHAFTQAIKRQPAEDCFWCENSNEKLKQIEGKQAIRL